MSGLSEGRFFAALRMTESVRMTENVRMTKSEALRVTFDNVILSRSVAEAKNLNFMTTNTINGPILCVHYDEWR